MRQTHLTAQPAEDRKGTVVVSDYPNVRIHTYVSPPDDFLVTTHLVEGEAALVLFDGQLLNASAAEVAAYASRLGKPVERIIVSYGHPDHWASQGDFPMARPVTSEQGSERSALGEWEKEPLDHFAWKWYTIWQ